MPDASRRQSQRFPCDVSAALHSPSTGALIGPARLVDIGLGGALIDTAVPLERRVPYELRWRWRGEELRIAGRVAWEAQADPREKSRRFGLSFTTTAAQEAQLRQMTDDVRHRLWSNRG